MIKPCPSPWMEPSGRMMDVYVPIPAVDTPNMVPLSSNDTSVVSGPVEITRLTSLFPLVSPILSPIMHSPALSPALLNDCSRGAQLYARNECAGFSCLAGDIREFAAALESVAPRRRRFQ